mgnify:CR=1 FL=1
MIIARSPFRITLGGGGTDMPNFYSKHGSFFVSAAIDKYIYVALKKNILDTNIRCQYLATEVVKETRLLKHDRARECLSHFDIKNGVEIVSIADLPSGSGLGSSGSYIVALLKCLHAQNKKFISRDDLAELAFDIEMNRLGEPVGKQDQYIASWGGIRKFTIDKQGHVTNRELRIPDVSEFYKRCKIYFTNTTRNASKILAVQHANPPSVEECMMQIQDIGFKSSESLEAGNFDKWGQLLHEHWQTKKQISKKMTVSSVEQLYTDLYDSGLVLGGKIIGAGGGGFMMLYIPKDIGKVNETMENAGFKNVPFRFDYEGCNIVEGRDEKVLF